MVRGKRCLRLATIVCAIFLFAACSGRQAPSGTAGETGGTKAESAPQAPQAVTIKVVSA